MVIYVCSLVTSERPVADAPEDRLLRAHEQQGPEERQVAQL